MAYIQTAFVNTIIVEGYVVNMPIYKKAVNGVDYVIFTIVNKVKQETLPEDGTPSILRDDNFLMCIAFDKICSLFKKYYQDGCFVRVVGTLRSNLKKSYIHVSSIEGYVYKNGISKEVLRTKMNKIIISGWLVNDPKFVPGDGTNKSRAMFSIGNTTGYGKYEKTTFFNCVAFGKTAEYVSQHYTKGNPLYVIGTICENKYTAQDGTQRSLYQVSVESIEYICKKIATAEEAQKKNVVDEATKNFDISGDDLPF